LEIHPKDGIKIPNLAASELALSSHSKMTIKCHIFILYKFRIEAQYKQCLKKIFFLNENFRDPEQQFLPRKTPYCGSEWRTKSV
jgi:hypothetical protein